ncbi:SWIM zinc finger-containing protein [Nocardia seriolae]|uniref:SWIM-type domain-containing protein n=1 Tax=Nocardia seriolae TaxID=37332 RepID=A0A0B8N5M7_9NOCA|nr:SWIM zinc finger-containing protein [Nocardia seriolae]APA99936.1 hypothetical protein NS506_05900 [Nocardia seriolae]MTJ64621.1 hypothetical protein [Nocardia seriolae]MTJ72110.1 hypothetical protein [Nocardia seriolae]MTJ89464.1 hypothetical protein [Nocardia seriolae]MTK33440.1 hypothetical protein [Nocardia seriolae]
MADNEFGYTAWARDWLRLPEPLNLTKPEPLLPRARSIARNNGVRTEIEGSVVRAHIHRGSEASVTHLELTTLPHTTIAAIAAVVPADSLTLNDQLHAAVIAAGLSVTPILAATDCSCRARNARCLHMLATCYAVIRLIDENPWLALDLQGYRSTAPAAEAETPTSIPRWTPIDALDPAVYFG